MFRTKVIGSIVTVVSLVLFLTISFFYSEYSASSVTGDSKINFNVATPSAVILSVPTHDFTSGYATTSILLPNNSSIEAYISSTEALQSSGLSNWPSLPVGTGMLFVFNQPNFLGFWMKDMKFSLDMIWLDEKMTVVDIRENISPETYPNVFNPTVKAKYVLEVPAGFCVKNKIILGSNLIWTLPGEKKMKK